METILHYIPRGEIFPVRGGAQFSHSQFGFNMEVPGYPPEIVL